MDMDIQRKLMGHYMQIHLMKALDMVSVRWYLSEIKNKDGSKSVNFPAKTFVHLHHVKV
jgi:hypothetical protein